MYLIKLVEILETRHNRTELVNNQCFALEFNNVCLFIYNSKGLRLRNCCW
jgi:hypothetical protein